MNFEVTPEEAQKIATTLYKHYKRKKTQVKIEKPAWEDAHFRTTLVAEKGGKKILIEAQWQPGYNKSLRELASWIAAKRHYAEFYIATGIESNLGISELNDMKKDGVGLLSVKDDGGIEICHPALNHALVVNPEPTLRYGYCKNEVIEAVHKFNRINRKDGLRDMCELVERETEHIGVVAIKRSWINKTEEIFKSLDWFNQINLLAKKEVYNKNRSPLFSHNFKDDMQSFRNARNLIDHKVSGKREDSKRQRQYAERMVQGPRLIHELMSLKRKIK